MLSTNDHIFCFENLFLTSSGGSRHMPNSWETVASPAVFLHIFYLRAHILSVEDICYIGQFPTNTPLSLLGETRDRWITIQWSFFFLWSTISQNRSKCSSLSQPEAPTWDSDSLARDTKQKGPFHFIHSSSSSNSSSSSTRFCLG